MERDQLQSFNERLSQWISQQGFWFQLRYSMSGGGYTSATYHFLRLLFKLALVGLVLVAGAAVYLLKRTDTNAFPATLQASIGSALGASKTNVNGFVRRQGRLNIRILTCNGGQDAFYSSIRATGVNCDMGLLDGVVGKWKPGQLRMDTLDMELRAGSDDAGEAARRGESFFKTLPSFDASSLDALTATVRWGLQFDPAPGLFNLQGSADNHGSIEKSHLSAQRIDNEWRLTFHGGQFNYGMLQKLEIENLILKVDSAGIHVEKGEFRLRGEGVDAPVGTVEFANMMVKSGPRPTVSGTARLKNAPLDALLPVRFDDFIEGSITTDLRMSGSSNTSEGVSFEGQVILEGRDKVTLRNQIPLLRALTNVSTFQKYQRVVFGEGAFTLKSVGRALEIREMNMKAVESGSGAVVMTLQGAMKARPPTVQEIERALSGGGTANTSAIFSRPGDNPDAGKEDVSLDKAGKLAKEEEKNEKKDPREDDAAMFNRLGQGQADKRSEKMREESREAIARTLRYEGLLRITLPGDSFERAGQLSTLYPSDPVTGRISMDVPLEGSLYEVTIKQAEEIYLKGRRQG